MIPTIKLQLQADGTNDASSVYFPVVFLPLNKVEAFGVDLVHRTSIDIQWIRNLLREFPIEPVFTPLYSFLGVVDLSRDDPRTRNNRWYVSVEVVNLHSVTVSVEEHCSIE